MVLEVVVKAETTPRRSTDARTDRQRVMLMAAFDGEIFISMKDSKFKWTTEDRCMLVGL